MMSVEPMRCARCNGSGDIPIIQPDSWIDPERHALLECCPDCGGTGWIPEGPVMPSLRVKDKRKGR